MSVPEPKPLRLVCSLCELDWDAHLKRTKKPGYEDCIVLLKAELAKRPTQNWQPSAQPFTFYHGTTHGAGI